MPTNTEPNYAGVSTRFDGTSGDDVARANPPAGVTGFTVPGSPGLTAAELLALLQDLNGDEIYGFGGNDTIVAGVAADTIYGGDGNDSILGGGGNDSIFGDDGDDFINGFEGADTVDGGAGSDVLRLTLQGDVNSLNSASNEQLTNVEAIFAQFANASINLSSQTEGFQIGAVGNSTVVGSQGIDTFELSAISSVYTPNSDSALVGVEIVSAENVTFFNPNPLAGGNLNLSTQTESFTIKGGVNNDTLVGGAGNDTFVGGMGADALVGGLGNDLLTDDLGTDYLFGDAGRDTLLGGAEADYLDGGADADSIVGGVGNDTFLGQAGDDILEGGTGNDYILAGEGADVATGGLDNDTLLGGLGNDNLDGGDGTDAIGGDAGNDTLVGGLGNDYMLGGADDDLLDGGTGAGNDQLYGEAGNDILIGGQDSDFLAGGIGADQFVFGGMAMLFAEIGLDTIADFAAGDQLVLNQATFRILSSLAGSGFSNASEFASVNSNEDTSAAVIVYNSSTGGLFYNQNGSQAGYGLGGQFAILSNGAALTASDFTLIDNNVS
jgi:Ca2+-binding RTX toxin-like protein